MVLISRFVVWVWKTQAFESQNLHSDGPKLMPRTSVDGFSETFGSRCFFLKNSYIFNKFRCFAMFFDIFQYSKDFSRIRISTTRGRESTRILAFQSTNNPSHKHKQSSPHPKNQNIVLNLEMISESWIVAHSFLKTLFSIVLIRIVAP